MTKKVMKSYAAKFSNGAEFSTKTSRPTAFAWRVESPEMSSGWAGGFSSTYALCASARDSWVARLKKNGGTITFVEIAPVQEVM